MPTKETLAFYRAMPLQLKIRMTQQRIREWHDHFGGDVCVSFSGGKDSTVLAHLVHGLYPDVPLVFANTGLEYPEIQAFARKMGAEFVRPKMRFDEVISTYGYPLISKEVAEAIHFARRIVTKNPGSVDFVEREREREREYKRRCGSGPNWKETEHWKRCGGGPTWTERDAISARRCRVEKSEPHKQPSGHKEDTRTKEKSFRTQRDAKATTGREYKRIQRARRWLMGKD